MTTTPVRPPLQHRRELLGILVMLAVAATAIVISPLWLVVPALLAMVNLTRYALAVADTGHITAASLSLAVANAAVLAAAGTGLLVSMVGSQLL